MVYLRARINGGPPKARDSQCSDALTPSLKRQHHIFSIRPAKTTGTNRRKGDQLRKIRRSATCLLNSTFSQLFVGRRHVPVLAGVQNIPS
jgi:hypothetical protein